MKSSFVNEKISRQIFIYFIIFSLIIISFIGLATKFVLPSYYAKRQQDILGTSIDEIKSALEQYDYNTVEAIMGKLQEETGGKLYYFGTSNEVHGNELRTRPGRGGGEYAERFRPSGDITDYEYKNKIGIKIRVIGVKLEDGYIVYEVSIHTLNKAASTMMEFILIMIIPAIILSLFIAYTLSHNISKPIQDLNKMAQSMKTKDVEARIVVKQKNEIGELNQTLNELYEELRGNIFKLDAELNKERNAELLKKRFLAQATHELKTPIAVIRGYAEILYDGMYKDEEEFNHYVQNIFEETEAISHLIIDVLEYTKLETGNYTLKLEEVSIDEFIIPLIERYRTYAETKDIKFNVTNNLTPGFTLKIDKERIAQVYKNLIINAIEYAENTVVTEINSIGSKLKISVFNDGEGINPQDLPNIFDSFYKAEGKKSGSGLGLAIVKEIVSLHGGEYWAENMENGVRFVVLIQSLK